MIKATNQYTKHKIYFTITITPYGPVITLLAPTDQSYYCNDTTLLFNASVWAAQNIQNATWYSTLAGGWQPNSTTLYTIANNSEINFSQTINTTGFYEWNVLSCDSQNNCTYASGNYTMAMLKDWPECRAQGERPIRLWDIVVVLGLLGSVFMLERQQKQLDEKHQALKFLMLFVSLFLSLMIISVVTNIAEAESAATDIISNLDHFYMAVLFTVLLLVGWFMIWVLQTYTQPLLDIIKKKPKWKP